MAGDWIKLSRKMLESPIMQHDGLCRLWVYCLIRANWKPQEFLVAGTTNAITVSRGQFITGRRALHVALYPTQKVANPSESTLWRWLQSLEQFGCVALRNLNNHCTLVSVVKYETYQARDKDDCTTDEQPTDNRRTADEPPMNTIEEGKKERRKEGKTSGASGAFVKPTVAEVDAYCLERKNGITGEEFVTKNDSIGWVIGKNRTPMKDWKAAIRTWESFRAKSAPAAIDPEERCPSFEEQKRRGWNPITGLGPK